MSEEERNPGGIEGSVVPAPLAGRNGGVPALCAEAGVDGLAHTLLNTELPWIDRRRQGKQLALALFRIKGEQLRVVEAVVGEGVRTNGELALQSLAAYRHHVSLQIRKALVKMFRDIGREVELDQLHFVTDFAEELTRFEGSLGARTLAQKFRGRIDRMIDDAFTRMCDSLEELCLRVLKQGAAASVAGR
jgi:hypothetical protein